MVIVVETEQGRHSAESRLKSVTGGDRIKARFMRQDFFEFEPQFKLIVLGNQKPALRSTDEAMRRRLHLVPLAVTIPQRDPKLVEKLKAERDGILGWALDGCAEVQRTGLAPPPAVVEATREYFEEEDAVGQWLAECCLEAPSVTRTRDLFRSWIGFADGADHGIGTQTALKLELLRRGYPDERDGRGHRGVGGIALRAMAPGTGGAR